MHKRASRLLGLLAVGITFGSAALASAIPVGYVSWDVNIPGSVGKFNIANFTGINTAPPDFPVTTAVGLTGLSLTVHFLGGTTSVFGSSYFTLGLDGLSFDGGDIAIGGANPLPTDATLTGSFSTTAIDVSGLGALNILPSFTATILPSSGSTLSDFDFRLINVETTSGGGPTVPEPNTLLLGGLACALALSMSRRKPSTGLAPPTLD